MRGWYGPVKNFARTAGHAREDLSVREELQKAYVYRKYDRREIDASPYAGVPAVRDCSKLGTNRKEPGEEDWKEASSQREVGSQYSDF
jgi:hypothetical protein